MIAFASDEDGEARAAIEDAASLSQLHAESRGVDDARAGGPDESA